VIAAIVVTLPFLSGPVALPVLARLVHKDISLLPCPGWSLPGRMTAALARALPGRDIHVVADAYGGARSCAVCPLQRLQRRAPGWIFRNVLQSYIVSAQLSYNVTLNSVTLERRAGVAQEL
jgi:hypothetical protein